MTKMIVVFDISEGHIDAYALAAEQMIQHHMSAEQQHSDHWSFDVEMRPLAAALIENDDVAGAADAYATVDQAHPWIPGGVFVTHRRFKDVLLTVLAALRA